MNRLRLAVIGFVVLATAILAGHGAMAGDGRPALPQAKGSVCVEDTQVMRRNHMDLLKHQRNDTLRQGVRGGKHSLAECVSCHATDGADGKPVPVTAEGQFCQSCHSFAAVSIDCFSCHATVPADPARTAIR
ncbi:MAG: Hdr-like menaquinol oxidoreductase cytochrome c subunit [Magnetospirillum sp.]|nr:Hdr-like menaquinol oxidoreductase cytochrome c subunit [Magnetospirillum sp.]